MNLQFTISRRLHELFSYSVISLIIHLNVSIGFEHIVVLEGSLAVTSYRMHLCRGEVSDFEYTTQQYLQYNKTICYLKLRTVTSVDCGDRCILSVMKFNLQTR